jgi:hypothetical protein
METSVNGIIYKILFPNGKTYIGITTCDLQKRQNEHKSAAKSGKSQLVYNALRKYNMLEDKFCEKIDTASSLEELCEKEKNYIIEYNSYYINECGYNMTYGGEGNHGYVFTEDDKEKMSESQKKRFERPEEREKNVNRLKDFWDGNDEAKEKMSKLKEELCTLEWRQIQSEIIKQTHDDNPNLAINHSIKMKQLHVDNPELAIQHSIKMKQMHADDPDLARRNGEKLKQSYIDNPELRIKNSESQKKRFERPEEKEKLSKIHKQRFQDNPLAKINKNMPYKPFNVYNQKTKECIGSYDYKFQAIDDINKRFKIRLNSGNIHKLLEGIGKSAKGMTFEYKFDNKLN